MAEWHVTPDYIVNNWTDELLELMLDKLLNRIGKERYVVKPELTDGRFVPDHILFNQLKGAIKVVKNGN